MFCFKLRSIDRSSIISRKLFTIEFVQLQDKSFSLIKVSPRPKISLFYSYTKHAQRNPVIAVVHAARCDFNSSSTRARIDRNVEQFIYWRKCPRAESSVAAPVLSRIQFGHCPRFHLQRGITVVYIGGPPSSSTCTGSASGLRY